MDKIADLSQTVKILRDNIQCPLCFDVINNSVTTRCNHHFCCCCFKKLFATRGSVSCPVCHAKVSRRSYERNEFVDGVVLAVEGIISSLHTDTGIDFCKEEVISSSREASCTSLKQPQSAESKKFHGPPVHNSGETMKERKCVDVKNRANKPDREERYKRQYKSKRDFVDDSFLFPADFIHPRPHTKQRDKAPINKVESWLQANEENLDFCEDVSIVNGNLPKKAVSTEVPNYFSDEELLSISQVNCPIARTYVAPCKSSVNDILQKPENATEIPTPKLELNIDPYEFVNSQKSAQNAISKKPRVANKRQSGQDNRRSKKPLWQDMSHLVQKTCNKKGEKRQVTDTSFQASIAVNDTFDDLLAGTKNSNTTAKKMPTIHEVQVDENTNCGDKTGDHLIFKSQTNAQEEWEKSITSGDFSSGSGEEWRETKKSKVNRQQRKSGKGKNVTPKLKLTSRKARPVTKNETANKLAEDINQSFEEINNYKLVTASQVEMEIQATKRDISDVSTIFINLVDGKEDNSSNKDGQEESSTDCEERIEEASSAEENKRPETLHNVSKKTFPSSQGWSRMSKLKREFTAPKKCPLKTLNMSADTLKRKLSSNEKNSSLKSDDRNAGVQLESKKFYLSKENKKLENTRQNKCVTDHADLSPPVSAPSSVCFSSPDEPVKYFELSQSQERFRVMQNIVHSEELNIAKEEAHLENIEETKDLTSAPLISQLSLTMCSAPNIDDLVSDGVAEILQNRFNVCNFESNTQISAVLTDGETHSEYPVCIEQKDKVNMSNYAAPAVKDKYPAEHMSIPPTKAGVLTSIHENLSAREQMENSVCQSHSLETKSDKNLPLSYDPFKCSDKSSDEIPPGQISRETTLQPVVKFTKASKFIVCHKHHVAFLYLGSCVSQWEKRHKISRWIVKISASEPATAIRVEKHTNDCESPSQVKDSTRDPRLFSSIECIEPALQAPQNLHLHEVIEDNNLKACDAQQPRSSNSQDPLQGIPAKDLTSKSCDLPTTKHPSKEKDVSPPSLLSAINDNSCEVFTGSPTKMLEDQKTDRQRISQSAAESSVNGRSSEDDDYLLTSEELLQRVRDNINEDLGIGKSGRSNLKGTRKKLPSYSDDEILEGLEGELASRSLKKRLALSGSDCSRKRHLAESEVEYEQEPRKKFHTSDESPSNTRVTIKPCEKNSEKGLLPNSVNQHTEENSMECTVGPAVLSNEVSRKSGNMNADQDLFLDDENDVIEGTPMKDSTFYRHKSPEKCEDCNNTAAKHHKTQKPFEFILPHSSRSVTNEDDTDKTHEKLHSSREAKSLQLPESANNPECGNINMKSVRKSARNLFGTSKANEKGSEQPSLSMKQIYCSSEIIQKEQSSSDTKSSLPNTTRDNSHFNKKVFVCSGLNQNLVLKVKTFAKLIGAEFSDVFTVGMTHLIVNVDENRGTTRTLKYLQAVASGKWIVSFSWIVASLSAQKFLPEEEFEVLDTLGIDGPHRSRLRTRSLLQDIQICLVEPFSDITIDKLQEIIVMCGGTVIKKLEDFQNTSNGFRVIILEPVSTTDEDLLQRWLLQHKAIALNSDWLLDCVGTYCLQPLPAFCLGNWSCEQLLQYGVPEELLVEEDLETTAGYSEVSGVSRLQTSYKL